MPNNHVETLTFVIEFVGFRPHHIHGVVHDLLTTIVTAQRAIGETVQTPIVQIVQFAKRHPFAQYDTRATRSRSKSLSSLDLSM